MSKKLFYYGSTSSAPAWTDDYSVDFDGVNEYVILPNAFSSLATGAFSFWIKVMSHPSAGTDRTVFSLSDSDDAFSDFRIGVLYHGGFLNIDLIIAEAGTINFYAKASDTGLLLNTWFHIVIMQTGTAIKMYVNGANQTISSIAGYPAATTKWINHVTNIDFTAIGARRIGSVISSYIDAVIGDVGIYNAGDITKVAEKYNGGVPNDLRTLSDAANLVGYYLMGDLTGTAEYPTIIDRISGNNGTMTNMEAADIVNDTP